MNRTVLALLVIVACTGPDPNDDDPIDTEVTQNVHDPLSMPAQPTVTVEAFHSAQECGACHPDQLAQWKTSSHAYAMVDPAYQRLVRQRQIDLAATEDQFCTQCHSAIGTRGGECVSGFDFDGLSAIVMEGVTCESCHKIQSVVRDYNAGHVLDHDGPMLGPIADPVENTYHTSEYSALFEDSQICGSCHDVIETSGLNLERPYQEWLESPSNEAGETCQDCHMPEYDGTAAAGAPQRVGLHDHRFIGVDVPFLEGFLTPEEEEIVRARVEALLATAVTMELLVAEPRVAGETIDLVVTVDNKIGAHNFPTGTTFVRQAWIEVVATDAEGTVIYETGTLDANGDLKDHYSALEPYADEDLITMSSRFTDSRGNPVIFPWLAEEHTSASISPGYDRTWTLFVPTTPGTPGPVQVTSRVRFRTFPPFLLGALGLGDYVEKIPIHDLASHAIEVELR